VGGKHNKCCCAQGCEIARDHFDRDNANPPNGSWSVLSGEWEIASNRLRSITDGVIVTTKRQSAPTRVGKGYNSRVFVDLVIPATGTASWGVITAFTSLTDFRWIRLDYSAGYGGGQLTPTFYQRSGASDSVVIDTTTNPGGEVWTPSPGTNFPMVFCNANVEWSAAGSADQGDVIWQTCTAGGLTSLPTSPNGGVGFLFGEFDNWIYEIHWESRLDCQRCNCICLSEIDPDDYSCLPETLNLVVTQDGANTCPCIDGLELDLIQCDADTSGASPIRSVNTVKKTWYSDVFICQGETIWFKFSCTVGARASLEILTYPAKTGSAFYLELPLAIMPADAADSTCIPIVQVFKGLTTHPATCDILDGTGTPIGTGTGPAVCTECGAGTPTMPTWTVTVTV